MSITFEVSDVASDAVRLPDATIAEAMHARLQAASEAHAANLDNLVVSELHPFVQTVHEAFDKHLPLTLSPDDVWLCIAQAFAMHIDKHAEQLRDRFVRHAGKTEIVVIRDGFVKGSADNDWPGVFGAFSDAIASHIGKQRELVVADFSTTGATERAASEVVLMSAMRHYFDYTLITRCGIPRITLLGTPADWRAIEQRARVLAEYGLEIDPTALAQLTAAAEGKPDRAMWQSFYKLEGGSGGPYANGWINALFPYIGDGRPNVPKRRGTALHEFPSGLSIAPFLWKYLGRDLKMELVAGFVAVSQDPTTLGVRPAIGWAVRAAKG